MRADDPDALALEDGGEPDEQAVVAAAKQLGELGRALHRSPVEPQVRELGARDRADHRHFRRAATLQRGEQLAHLAQSDPGVRIGFDARIGYADDADQERVAARAAGVGGDLERKRAGAAQDRERRRRGGDPLPRRRVHASSPLPSRGTQTARSPPSRRKATICCTASSSGNASATSPTRSLSVPLPANSIR